MVKIAELRKRAGLTQQKLAAQLCVCQSTVAMWENGTNTPQSTMLPKLAEVLCCRIDDLFERSEA